VSVLAGPFTIAAALLAFGGAHKALHPRNTAQALTAVGVRVPGVPAHFLVRAGGAAEVVVGIGALVTGGAVFAALVAVSYALFAGFVVVALRADSPISSCGCFGKVDTPPSVVHVVVDAAFALVAVAAAVPDVLADQPLLGIPFLFLVVIGVSLVYLAFTSLPKTMAAVREVAA
jgi:hypothetical protein